MANIVYIATSLDGYIADKENRLDWLNEIPNPNHIDCGFANFMNRIDAIIMGRNTFETVLSFDCKWPYKKPVFVLSNSLQTLPDVSAGKAELIKGSPKEVVEQLNQKGMADIYIDGGKTVQSFLKHDLIDEMVITTVPILLGAGIPLFAHLESPVRFSLLKSDIYLDSLVQNHYAKIT